MRTGNSAGTLGRWNAALIFAVTVAFSFAQQARKDPRQSEILPMPEDRAAESYQIYSQLLPGSQIEWGDARRSFWLVEAATKAEPLDSPCATGGTMNPHQAVEAPESQQENFAEVLADFDKRCHERYQLVALKIQVKLPIRLLDEEGQKRYANRVSSYMPPPNNIMQAPPTPEEFKGAAGVHTFTAVYFNQAHTLAMTKIGMYCGGLCGNWSWVVLERKSGRWETLPWVRMSMVSRLSS